MFLSIPTKTGINNKTSVDQNIVPRLHLVLVQVCHLQGNYGMFHRCLFYLRTHSGHREGNIPEEICNHFVTADTSHFHLIKKASRSVKKHVLQILHVC